MILKKEKIDLKKLAEEVLETYQVAADEKKIHLEIESPQKSPEMIGDRDRLMQVIINLLYNAIKFIPDNGTITVRLSEDSLNTKIEIEDNGPGMSSENLEKIFDKFERVTAEKKEGTGLGLPISKDIVSLHKGKIWVESKEGKGSKFIVTLPKK